MKGKDLKDKKASGAWEQNLEKQLSAEPNRKEKIADAEKKECLIDIVYKKASAIVCKKECFSRLQK